MVPLRDAKLDFWHFLHFLMCLSWTQLVVFNWLKQLYFCMDAIAGAMETGNKINSLIMKLRTLEMSTNFREIKWFLLIPPDEQVFRLSESFTSSSNHSSLLIFQVMVICWSFCYPHVKMLRLNEEEKEAEEFEVMRMRMYINERKQKNIQTNKQTHIIRGDAPKVFLFHGGRSNTGTSAKNYVCQVFAI